MIDNTNRAVAFVGAAALIFVAVHAAAAPTASGQLVGKRRHQPLTIHKTVDSASPKLMGMAAGKRRHQPLSVRKPVDSAPPK